MSREPVDPGELRVSDAEREQVAQMLARAMVAGQLTPVEYSDRVAVAQAARRRGELDGLLGDLPGAVLHASLAVDALDLEAGLAGSLVRRGYWKVPPTVRVHSWVGAVTLDFTEAECVTPVVAVELATGLCSPEIVVPDGATVDVDELRVTAGGIRDQTVHRPGHGTPHLMVRGRHSFGEVVLRHPRRGRWERISVRVPEPLARATRPRALPRPGRRDRGDSPSGTPSPREPDGGGGGPR